MSVLDTILNDVKRRALARRRKQSLESLRESIKPDPARRERFAAALSTPKLALIAECKCRSPSGGLLFDGDLVERAKAYAAGGASALSILTEQDHFGGAPIDLVRVAGVQLPRLRKDFILDEGMLLESLPFGADAVLLIVACLEPGKLNELAATAKEFGLFCLVEVHEESELEAALAAGADAIGVNARNLTTMEVDSEAALAVLKKIPKGTLRVAESGMRCTADLIAARDAGADAALVGEALVTAADPAALLREWIDAL